MASSVEQLRWERRRKLQVRESFSGGLQHFKAAAADPFEFYLACGDYLVAGQQRLIDQDRRLVDTLAPRVPAAQAADHEAMLALRGRLDLAERTMKDFSGALAELRRRGSAGRVAFEAASARFLDVVVNVLGARSHSLRHLTGTLLSEDDWKLIADMTPDFIAAEGAAFAAIGRLAPPGLDPENMMAQGRPEAAPAAGTRQE